MGFAGSGQVESSGSGTITALDGAVTVNIPTSASLVFHITGTWSATLTFEGSVDGTNFFTIPATVVSSGAQSTTATSNGAYLIGVGGYATGRIRASSYTSGTAAVSWSADNTPNIQATVQQGNAPWSVTVPGGIIYSQESSNPQLDAFGRMRVSSPETIFDSTFRWDKQPVTWSESTASGGTVTHNANQASVDLTCTTTTNSSAIFQSRRYIRYHPGKSQLVMISGNFISAATSVTKRFGYYETDNGIYFQLSGSTLSVVRRTSVSGSVVNNVTDQANWNIDKLDGTGTSGLTLDITKQQIFVIDFQWLGSGRIRYGFMINGALVYCHADSNANILDVPWSQTGDAPIRTEILNSGSTSSSMHITCCAVICENYWGPEGLLRSINNGSTPRSFGTAGTTIPVISLRKQSTYINVPIKIIDLQTFTGSADDFLISIVYNGSLTGASWTNVSGIAQQDVAATAISGGTTVYSEYVRGSTGGDGSLIADVFRDAVNTSLGRDVAGTSDIVSLVATNITASASLYGCINYREFL